MSTYYRFYCDKCREAGGFLTQQAWGSGNFNIIETFKFTMYHAMRCGASSVHMAEEQTDEYDYPETPAIRTLDIFPSSNDWRYIADRLHRMDWMAIKLAWQADHLRVEED